MSWPKKAGQSRDKFKEYQKRYNQTPKGLWNRLKDRAKRARGGAKPISITFEQFVELIDKPCYYCGGQRPTQGLDRIDNDKGYHLDNLRPCCWRCNKFKGSKKEQDFIEMCHAVSRNLGR